MTILKSEIFSTPDLLAKFVNDNKISKDDIVQIIAVDNDVSPLSRGLVIFFYGDPEVEQKVKGFWR